MKKKLDTRFPAVRIKKIMQADEDVGKIALAVPVLVSKALELFLQDLCDRSYEITLQRGAKTLNSLHLKHCVQSYNVFDFLRDVVSRVPDYGHGHSDVAADDRAFSKRRKSAGDGCNDSDEDLRRSKMLEINHGSSSGIGRGRVRGRGRGRGVRTVERKAPHVDTESDPCTSIPSCIKHRTNFSMLTDNASDSKELSKENISSICEGDPAVQNFDFNSDVPKPVAGNGNENMKKTEDIQATKVPSAESVSETKQEEYPGWSFPDMDQMAVDPIKLADLTTGMDEDDEDYDEEG